MSRNVSTLVSVGWLEEAIATRSSNVRLLEISCSLWFQWKGMKSGREQYMERHIPTAQLFDIDECYDKQTVQSPYPHMLPSPKEFEEYVGQLGISNKTHVVVYDKDVTYGLFLAPRVWWTFRVFGHKSVSILNGGFPKWLAEGHETTQDVEKVTPATFKATYQPHMVKHFEDIERNLKEKRFLLLDARRPGSFYGTSPPSQPGIKPGHVRGAVHFHMAAMLNPETKMVKEPDELRDAFKQANIDLSQPLVSMCGTGVTACIPVLGAYLCGVDNIPVYDGSWGEYYYRAREEDKEDVPS